MALAAYSATMERQKHMAAARATIGTLPRTARIKNRNPPANAAAAPMVWVPQLTGSCARQKNLFITFIILSSVLNNLVI